MMWLVLLYVYITLCVSRAHHVAVDDPDVSAAQSFAFGILWPITMLTVIFIKVLRTTV